MNFPEYIKDKILTILMQILCMTGSFIYLYTCGMKKNQLLLFYLAWLFLLAVWFTVDWYRRSRYFKELFHISDPQKLQQIRHRHSPSSGIRAHRV